MFKLNEALNAIKDKPEFNFQEKDGYSVIDYNIQTLTTFVGRDERETEILQNLRGACFDSSGNIVRLPFHKFHNLNECAGYMESDIDFNAPHYIMEKLDGSMIAPVRIGNKYRLGTRAGVTDVSMIAETWLSEQPEEFQKRYDDLIEEMLLLGLTPIFEFCSRMNKVVIDHPEPHLTLIAVRENSTGIYQPKSLLETLGMSFNIPVVKFHTPEVFATVKGWEDSEGIVVAFENGKRVKIKADAYVLRHRAKDMIRFEKDVVRIILEDKLDDVLPIVDADVRTNLLEFAEWLKNTIITDESAMKQIVDSLRMICHSKKEFAMTVNERIEFKIISSFLFKVYDGKEPEIKEYLLKNCSSSANIERAFQSLGYTKRWVL